jgi:hypothetical protein
MERYDELSTEVLPTPTPGAGPDAAGDGPDAAAPPPPADAALDTPTRRTR